MCPHRMFDDPTGLACDRTDAHETGHRYHASDAPDRHAATEPEDY